MWYKFLGTHSTFRCVILRVTRSPSILFWNRIIKQYNEISTLEGMKNIYFTQIHSTGDNELIFLRKKLTQAKFNTLTDGRLTSFIWKNDTTHDS